MASAEVERDTWKSAASYPVVRGTWAAVTSVLKLARRLKKLSSERQKALQACCRCVPSRGPSDDETTKRLNVVEAAAAAADRAMGEYVRVATDFENWFQEREIVAHGNRRLGELGGHDKGEPDGESVQADEGGEDEV